MLVCDRQSRRGRQLISAIPTRWPPGLRLPNLHPPVATARCAASCVRHASSIWCRGDSSDLQSPNGPVERMPRGIDLPLDVFDQAWRIHCGVLLNSMSLSLRNDCGRWDGVM